MSIGRSKLRKCSMTPWRVALPHAAMPKQPMPQVTTDMYAAATSENGIPAPSASPRSSSIYPPGTYAFVVFHRAYSRETDRPCSIARMFSLVSLRRRNPCW
ncbi:MAG: hypothetical protein R6U10_04715 [Thermoplasmatota archaeon]